MTNLINEVKYEVLGKFNPRLLKEVRTVIKEGIPPQDLATQLHTRYGYDNTIVETMIGAAHHCWVKEFMHEC
jgi:hypothetical protein